MEKSCGGVIFNKNNHILLIKHNQGHWSFPKGHMEKGESDIETALREIKEEVALDVFINRDIYAISSYTLPSGIKKEVIYFLCYCENDDVVLQKSEVCEYLFLPYEEAIKQITYFEDVNVLKEIYSKINLE